MSGRFPGFGTLVIGPGGPATVEPDCLPGDRDALLLGWATPLSVIVGGGALLRAAALCPPETKELAIAVAGDPLSVASTVLGLVDCGWLLVSDYPTAVRWEEDQLIAIPGRAPLLVPGSLATERPDDEGPVRHGSTTHFVRAARATAHAVVRAVGYAHPPRWGDPAIRALSGAERLRRASSLSVRGLATLPSGTQSGDPEAEDLQLARVPAAAVTTSRTGHEAAGSLTAWWEEVIGPGVGP